MKAEYVNAFLGPAIDVWQAELGTPLTFREAEAVTGVFTTEDLTAVVGVSGQLKGNVFYELSSETARSIAEAKQGAPFPEMNSAALSVIGDLADIIVEQSTAALAATNFRSDLTPPVLLPKGASVTVTNPQIRAHFDSALGEVSVRIGLTEPA